MSVSDRLQILSAEEYELLWGCPRFTQSDRDLFFTLTAPEREALEQRRSVRTKIDILLHLGYFRARQRHVDTIFGLFRYRLCALEERAMLEAHVCQAVRISSRPVYVLRELLVACHALLHRLGQGIECGAKVAGHLGVAPCARMALMPKRSSAFSAAASHRPSASCRVMVSSVTS